MFSLIKPFLFKINPETAHNLAIQSLKLNYLPSTFFKVDNEEMLKINLFGKTFSRYTHLKDYCLSHLGLPEVCLRNILKPCLPIEFAYFEFQ